LRFVIFDVAARSVPDLCSNYQAVTEERLGGAEQRAYRYVPRDAAVPVSWPADTATAPQSTKDKSHATRISPLA
jgi:hypothetical protein